MFDGGHVRKDKTLLLINFLPRRVERQRARKLDHKFTFFMHAEVI